MDSKNQTPANGELKDSELADVTGGTTNVVQLAKDAAKAGAAGAAEGERLANKGFGPILGGH
jgi:hypothetical protein